MDRKKSQRGKVVAKRGKTVGSPIGIGMVINTAVKPSRDVMLGIINACNEYPLVDLRFFHGASGTRAENIATFAKGLKGLIFCGMSRRIVVDFLRVMPNHPPVVLCVYTPFIDAEEGVSVGWGGQVLLDNSMIGRMAADFFLGHGLSSFAFFGTNVFREVIAAKIRLAAFRDRVQEMLGSPLSFRQLIAGHVEENEDYWDDRASKVKDFVSSLKLPCGVLVNGDRESLVLIKACRSLGIDVPGEIEILGINNTINICETSKPTISSIHPDHAAGAKASVEMLLALIANPNLPQERRFCAIAPERIVERGSTLSGRGYGGIAVKARDYIRINACNGISVLDVAESVGVSRRTVEKRFLEATGMSVGGMIREIRFKKICELLRGTDLPISEVAQRAGFPVNSNVSFQFRKTFGMSMRQYRKSQKG